MQTVCASKWKECRSRNKGEHEPMNPWTGEMVQSSGLVCLWSYVCTYSITGEFLQAFVPIGAETAKCHCCLLMHMHDLKLCNAARHTGMDQNCNSATKPAQSFCIKVKWAFISNIYHSSPTHTTWNIMLSIVPLDTAKESTERKGKEEGWNMTSFLSLPLRQRPEKRRPVSSVCTWRKECRPNL